MRHSIVGSIALVLAIGGCAKTSRDVTSQSPEEIEAEIEASTQKAENLPEDTEMSRVYIDEHILAACGIVMPQAFFEFAAADLDPDDVHELRQVAECLDAGALKDTRIGVVGHTDPRGSDEYNAELGWDRAETVADYLVLQGVERDRLNIDSMGEYLASADPDHWPADRRVDLILRSAPN